MLRERAAAFLAEAGQHVQHAGRQELLAHLRHQQHAKRRILRRLQHQRVAGAQGGRDLQRAQQHRRVPRDDGADDAKRLAARVARTCSPSGIGLALQFAGEAAEVAEDVGRQLRFGPRLGAQRIAGLPAMVRASSSMRASSARRCAAAAGRARVAAPCSRPGTPEAACNGPIDICRSAARDRRRRPCAWPGFSTSAPRRKRCHPLAGDQHPRMADCGIQACLFGYGHEVRSPRSLGIKVHAMLKRI